MKYKSRNIKLGKLQALLFIIVFAAIGFTYLLASHADNSFSISVNPSSVNVGGVPYFAPGDHLNISSTNTCGQTGSAHPYISQTGTYAFSQDARQNLFMSINGGQPEEVAGLPYCTPNPANIIRTVYSTQIGISNGPPSVAFTSTSTTTQASSVVVGATASAYYNFLSISSVRINGIAANHSGANYTATVPLTMGANRVTATATDNLGNSASSSAITITRTAPPAPAPAPPTKTSGSSGGSSGSTTSGSSHGTSSSGSSSTGSSSSSAHVTSSGTSGASGASSTAGSGSSNSGSGSTAAGAGSNTSSSDTSADDDTTAIASSTPPTVPAGSSATITSSDGLVNVAFPSGAFSVDAYCSIDGGSAKDLPAGSANAIGPYSLDCTDNDGNALSPDKPVAVTISLPSNKSNYAAYVDSTSWQKTASTNNQKTIKFDLVKAQQFAAIQSKSRNLGSIILNVGGGLVLLLVLGFVIFLIRRRQQTDKYVDYDNYINHNQPTPPPLQ